MLGTEAKSAVILEGKAVAARVRAEIAVKVRAFAAANGRAPGLAVVQVGSNPASSVYVRNKKKACGEAGIESFSFDPPDSVTRNELLGLVDLLNKDNRVDGILIQLPDALLRRACGRQGLTLPAVGQYGVGMVFLPQEPASRMACEQEIERAIAAEGQVLLGWRNVPVDDSGFSDGVKAIEPIIR